MAAATASIATEAFTGVVPSNLNPKILHLPNGTSISSPRSIRFPTLTSISIARRRSLNPIAFTSSPSPSPSFFSRATTPPSHSDAVTSAISSALSLVLSVAHVIGAVARAPAEEAATIAPLKSEEMAEIDALRGNLVWATGPLFFAAIQGGNVSHLNTPMTVVAAGMARWLEIYTGVLSVRVMLSWFPNIPWHRQPLSAIRDLCDPYLNLFRNIIPPVFDTLDVSPMLAFSVLGTLAMILKANIGRAF